MTLLLPQAARAQAGCAPSLNPDRPGATNAYLPIRPLCFQVETSAELSRDGDESTQSFPTALRLGLVDGAEIRLETNFLSLGGADGTQRGDVALGTKVLLLEPEEEGGALPGLGFSIFAAVPAGAELGDLAPRFDLLADWGLPAGWALSVNAAIEVANDDNDKRQATFPINVVLGWSVPGTDDNVGLFVDTSATLAPSGAASTFSEAFGGGIVWFPLPTVQLDFSGSAGAVGDETGWWLAAGVSWSMSLAGGAAPAHDG